MMHLMNRVIQRDSQPLSVLSLLFSNYAQSSEKLKRPHLTKYFNLLSRSFELQAMDQQRGIKDKPFNKLLSGFQGSIQEDLKKNYVSEEKGAQKSKNRGALRNFTWGKKVTTIQNSLIKRFLQSEGALVKENQRIFVCEACGFIGIGNGPPDLCPVCKAPSTRFVSF
jgi:rubrerythrin